MESEKPPKSESDSASPLSGSARDWVRQFVKHFELHFSLTSDNSVSSEKDDEEQLRRASVQAVVATLRDSGMSNEQMVESFGLTLFQSDEATGEWTAELDQRRIDLIDKDIQETLSAAEQLELAGLTSLMRAHVDSEANLPTAGAKELHKRLLELERKEKPR